MRSYTTVTTLCLTATLLCACQKAPSGSTPAAATASPTQTVPGTQTGGTNNTSVPPADAVMAPTTTKPADAAEGRTNGAMTRAQESSAMPLPGQNNDHSAPLATAKRASGP